MRRQLVEAQESSWDTLRFASSKSLSESRRTFIGHLGEIFQVKKMMKLEAAITESRKRSVHILEVISPRAKPKLMAKRSALAQSIRERIFISRRGVPGVYGWRRPVGG
jgi:hypothetical protein